MDDLSSHDDIMKMLLLEVIEEEVIDALEEVVVEGERAASVSSIVIDQREKVITQQILEGIFGELFDVELPAIASECFDDIIANHRFNLDAVQRVNTLLDTTIRVIAEEIVLDVIGGKLSDAQCKYFANSLLSDVITEECDDVSREVLDHYHMRVALSQYRQIQTSASSYLMDKLLLDSLLVPHDESEKIEKSNEKQFLILAEESDKLLSNVVLDVLLAQTLSLHSCFPKNLPTSIFKGVSSLKLQPIECLPLNWYRDKVVTAVAEEVAVTMLCDRLDESMQFTAQEHMKNEAVSLVTQILNN